MVEVATDEPATKKPFSRTLSSHEVHHTTQADLLENLYTSPKAKRASQAAATATARRGSTEDILFCGTDDTHVDVDITFDDGRPAQY